MGARMWWNWITKPQAPWDKLWQAKYVPGSHWTELIRINPTTQGSPIWNVAKDHSQFIQEHNFWEIHSGKMTRFWEDSWQQLPKLTTLFQKPLWQEQMQQDHLTQVHQFWHPTANHDFRTWIKSSLWQRSWKGETYEEIEQELLYRKIRYSTQQDRLRWGHQTKGTFTTKEAHRLRYTDNQADKDHIWEKIWQPGISKSLPSYGFILDYIHSF